MPETTRGRFLAKVREAPEQYRQPLIRRRCRSDVLLFAATYCNERLDLPFSRFHRDVLGRSKKRWEDRTTPIRYVDAAPRGSAKSTLISYVSVLHDIVYGIESFVCMISTTYQLSEDLVSDVWTALSQAELHPLLHSQFGPFKVIGSRTDFTVFAPGLDRRGCRVAAFSFGGSIRGVKHAGIRPTKIVIDDGENSERVRSPTQRAKTWDYLTKDILKAGDRFSLYQVIGTVLHADSMLSRLLGEHSTGSPGWSGARYQAVERWPTDAAIWQRCRDLWSDLTDEDREQTARGYFERNRDKMTAGSAVLWRQKESIFDLHLLLWSDGEASFYSEKQNVAVDPTRQIFYPDKWRRFKIDGKTITTHDGRKVDLNTCRIAVWLDPRASRETERNDYAAIAVVARDDLGYHYVITVDMRRDPVSGQLDRLWSFFGLHGHRASYGYEDNGFAAVIGDLLERQRDDRQKDGQAWDLVVEGHASTGNKNDRIMRLAPRIDLGWIQFNEAIPRDVVEQMRQFPTASHDDGPDAIERAIWFLEGGGRPSGNIYASWGI